VSGERRERARLTPGSGSSQLITVAATHATYAMANIWKDKREGDGATPAGTFPIGRTTYGNSPNPGVRFRYVRLHRGDWLVEDSRSRAYNTFQRVGCRVRPPFRITTPDMSGSPSAYAHLAVIEYNMHTVGPGRGSGIFLHVQIGKPTSGCISLRKPALIHVLRWLRPSARPYIAVTG
jgi:L,D-peptidoglycan transpeptidase YkuD (ErfK/YbiS/YcfS/YnhG family)